MFTQLWKFWQFFFAVDYKYPVIKLVNYARCKRVGACVCWGRLGVTSRPSPSLLHYSYKLHALIKQHPGEPIWNRGQYI